MVEVDSGPVDYVDNINNEWMVSSGSVIPMVKRTMCGSDDYDDDVSMFRLHNLKRC